MSWARVQPRVKSQAGLSKVKYPAKEMHPSMSRERSNSSTIDSVNLESLAEVTVILGLRNRGLAIGGTALSAVRCVPVKQDALDRRLELVYSQCTHCCEWRLAEPWLLFSPHHFY